MYRPMKSHRPRNGPANPLPTPATGPGAERRY